MKLPYAAPSSDVCHKCEWRGMPYVLLLVLMLGCTPPYYENICENDGIVVHAVIRVIRVTPCFSSGV
jgi:hypothetical protein